MNHRFGFGGSVVEVYWTWARTYQRDEYAPWFGFSPTRAQ
jgi:hypothetical protein